MSSSLRCKDLVRRFPGEPQDAVKQVSLELYPGQITLVMGPSGSGKSTLLACLSGLLHPTSGEVFALGQNLWQMTEKQREQFRLQHCGFIFQGFNLFPALTALQQVEMVLLWGSGLSRREARRQAEDMLVHLGLKKELNKRPSQMSGGEKQRVAIARAMIKQPTFCFADEPTSALDWDNGQEVLKLLQMAAKDRKPQATVLIVSHDHRITEFADRVLQMENGRLQDVTGELEMSESVTVE